MARAQDRVVIGYCHPTEVAAGFHDSMCALLEYNLIKGTGRLSGHLPRYSSANVSNARNWIVREFLEKATADWLLMIDADMTFEPTLLDDLLTNASMTRAPVVGGLCFGVDDSVLFPTLYGVAEGWEDVDGVHTIRFDEYPPNTMMQVAATGAACLLIHRTVLEKVRDAEAAKGNTAYPWFMEGIFNGHPCGEDVTFCHRVNALGIPVFVDTGVALGHQKVYTLTEQMYQEQRAHLRPPPEAVPPEAGDSP
jgi:hypothetical protein